jgi:hypothetical protein
VGGVRQCVRTVCVNVFLFFTTMNPTVSINFDVTVRIRRCMAFVWYIMRVMSSRTVQKVHM